MKKYTFKLIVCEGDDEFWEDINNRKVTGCEDVTEVLKEVLASHGFYMNYEFSNDELILEKYEEVEE